MCEVGDKEIGDSDDGYVDVEVKSDHQDNIQLIKKDKKDDEDKDAEG